MERGNRDSRYMTALVTKVVEVDDDVCGLVWSVNDLNELSKLIAVIALGQAQHAARIIVELEPVGQHFQMESFMLEPEDKCA